MSVITGRETASASAPGASTSNSSLLWLLVEPHLVPTLDRLYQRIQSNERLTRLFPTREATDAEDIFQVAHWRAIFDKVETSERKTAIRAVGARHLKLGLEPSDLFEAYTFVTDALLAAVATDTPITDGAAAAARLAAVQRAMVLSVMMDLATYMSVYDGVLGTRAVDVDAVVAQVERESTKVANSVILYAEDLHDAVRNLEASYSAVATGTDHVEAAARAALGNARSVATAAGELGGAMGEIARRVVGASDAVRAVDASAGVVTEAVARLTKCADEIDAIVTMTSALTRETKLVALDSSIEAMEAMQIGEPTKPYLDAATRIKNMADQSLRASGEVSDRLAAIRAVVAELATAIGGVSGSVNRVSQVNAAIAAAVEEQTAVTREIAQVAKTVADAASRVSGVVGGVKASTEEARRIVKRIESGADEVLEKLWHLPNAMSETVRAAADPATDPATNPAPVAPPPAAKAPSDKRAAPPPVPASPPRNTEREWAPLFAPNRPPSK